MAKRSIQRANNIEFKHELVRKSIHLVSLSIPIGYWYLGRATVLMYILPLFAWSLSMDIARFFFPSFAHWFYKVFRPLLREHELNHDKPLLTGATWLLISAAVCIQWFPKLITITAFSILIVSDTAAALFGRRFGKRIFFQKSLEGAFAFFISALVVLAFLPHVYSPAIEYSIGMIAALIGAIVESASIQLRFDDNLSIPLSIGGVMWGIYYLLAQLDPAKYQALYDAVVAF